MSSFNIYILKIYIIIYISGLGNLYFFLYGGEIQSICLSDVWVLLKSLGFAGNDGLQERRNKTRAELQNNWVECDRRDITHGSHAPHL